MAVGTYLGSALNQSGIRETLRSWNSSLVSLFSNLERAQRRAIASIDTVPQVRQQAADTFAANMRAQRLLTPAERQARVDAGLFAGGVAGAMNRAEQERATRVTEALARVNDEATRSQRRYQRAVSLTARGLVGLGAAYAVVQAAAIRSQDNFVRYRSQLRLVSSGIEDTEQNLQSLITVSLATRSPLETTIRLYTRMARAIRSANVDLRGVSIQDITQGILQTTAISGSTTQEASAAIIQFSQAIASNRFSGDELRSVAEQLPAPVSYTHLTLPTKA